MLNKRQDVILSYIDQHNNAAVSAVFSFMQKQWPKVSKITINRDLKKLVQLKLLVQTGSGRGTAYVLAPAYSIVKPIDVKKYFASEIDERDIKTHFNFEIFSQLRIMHTIFSEAEQVHLQTLQQMYQSKIKHLPPDVLRKEFERLTIELSWKSSKIEGNTYTLLETEQLIKEQQVASEHTKAEATMILNHKAALDYIRQQAVQFKKLSRSKIEDIHSLLIKDLGVSRNVRKTIVRITGTAYTPLDNIYQIQEALDDTCKLVNTEANPFAKAMLVLMLIAYIQPFTDGNKRTSRLIGNAVLLAHGCCPLSYRSINEIEYKKALLLFYEQNNITYFKKLFLEQLDFAVHNYFG
ncbi:MAG: Fic family protein [Patescibacteria group bacterium]|jgi:Fic family protein